MADRARRGADAAAEARRLRARLVEHLRAGGMLRTDAVAAASAGRFGGGGRAAGERLGAPGPAKRAGHWCRSMVRVWQRVSDARARTLLAEALRGVGRPLVTGFTELGTGRPPLVIIYVLLGIPARRRVWVITRERVGVGVLDRRGRGLALLSVPNPWLATRRRDGAPRERAGRTVRWRLDAYGAHGPALDELRQLLSDWDGLRREGRTDLEIIARPAGERLALRFRWRRAGAVA